MKVLKTQRYINELIVQKDIPYLDVCLYKGYDEFFRYTASKDGTATGGGTALSVFAYKTLDCDRGYALGRRRETF